MAAELALGPVAPVAPSRIGAGSFAARLARIGSRFAFWLALGAGLGLATLTALATLTGVRSYDVLSGSMEPAIGVGSVVWAEPMNPAEARVGDVITFTDPSDDARLITHRLRSMRVEAGVAHVTTQGDANPAPERWTVPATEQIGRVAYVTPQLGHARQWVADWGLRLLALAIFLLWIAPALVRVWRPHTDSPPAQEAQG